MPEPVFRKVDCLQIPVPDLDAGLAFYQVQLGHTLIWRTDTAAGLQLPEGNAEIVLQTERPEIEANLTVASIDTAVATIVEAGGRVLVNPFDIMIGRCAVVIDPWGNRLVLLDNSKGLLVTDDSGAVLGTSVLDQMADIIGAVEGDGKDLSSRTGEAFTDLLVEKYHRQTAVNDPD